MKAETIVPNSASTIASRAQLEAEARAGHVATMAVVPYVNQEEQVKQWTLQWTQLQQSGVSDSSQNVLTQHDAYKEASKASANPVSEPQISPPSSNPQEQRIQTPVEQATAEAQRKCTEFNNDNAAFTLKYDPKTSYLRRTERTAQKELLQNMETLDKNVTKKLKDLKQLKGIDCPPHIIELMKLEVKRRILLSIQTDTKNEHITGGSKGRIMQQVSTMLTEVTEARNDLAHTIQKEAPVNRDVVLAARNYAIECLSDINVSDPAQRKAATKFIDLCGEARRIDVDLGWFPEANKSSKPNR